jgi:hypothetical protein
MTNRTRWMFGGAAAVLVIIVGVAVAVASGGDDKQKPRAAPTTTTSTSTTTTTLPPTTTTVTVPVTVGIVCTTPEDATQSFVNAWIAGDRAAAERCATTAATDELFQNSGAGAQYTFQGCGGGDPGVPVCQYSYEGGAANFTLNGTESGGWKVVDVSYIAD